MILDGKLVANSIKEKVKNYTAINPDVSLTIVQVGNNPASNTYVRNKIRACEETGISSNIIKFETPEESDRCMFIPETLLNTDSTGVMLQLPLPQGWHEDYFVNLIDSTQDADCLTQNSLGKFYCSNNPNIAPCTVQGIVDLLDFYKIEIEGKRALVIGRSNIVGRPIAHLLETRNATVTLAHSKTPKQDLINLFINADIVIVAVGKPNFITEEDLLEYGTMEMNDENKVIIDVGINRTEQGKLCGDLSEEFKETHSKAFSPVPGGVGPLTVANLLYNTVKLHKKKNNIS